MKEFPSFCFGGGGVKVKRPILNDGGFVDEFIL